MAPQTSSIDHQVTYKADLALHEAIRSGLSRHRVVRRILRTTYLDTSAHDLHHHGITLRERCRIKDDGTFGTVVVEAKIPSADGLHRIAGDDALNAVADRLGHTVSAALHPVALQTKARQLLLTAGPPFAPQFVVALDDVHVEIDGQHRQRFEVETQIFTSLPWTKRVSAQRVGRFGAFCRQLELDFDLCPAADSGYHAIIATASLSTNLSEVSA